MKASNSRAAITLLVARLLVAVGVSSYEVWQNRQWKSLAHAYAASEGRARASRDFADGILQLYAISNPSSFTSPSATNKGPFQIRPLSYNPNVFQDLYTSEAFIEAYNDRMRFLHEHPEKAAARTNQ